MQLHRCTAMVITVEIHMSTIRIIGAEHTTRTTGLHRFHIPITIRIPILPTHTTMATGITLIPMRTVMGTVRILIRTRIVTAMAIRTVHIPIPIQRIRILSTL